MRVPALIARAFIVVFALASGLAGAAAAANINDSAGVLSEVGVESFRSGPDSLVADADRDRDRKAKQMERTGQVLANEDDVETADDDVDAEETAPTETVDEEDEETADTEDTKTADTKDTGTKDEDDTEDTDD